MNKIILIGRLTKDPELSTTNSGVSMCRFSLAVSRDFRNADGERTTDFFDIVVWRGQAENCHRYLKKGQQCAVSGRVEIRSFEATDGTKRRVTEIVADSVEFLAKSDGNSDYQPQSGESQAKPQQTKTPKVSELVEVDEDLPF